MSNWKEKFDSSSFGVSDKDELELEYKFGPPASETDIHETEESLKIIFPNELRSLLSEFNGIEAKDKYWGWRQLYLSTSTMKNELQEYLMESGNPMPPKEELERVVFFAQQNGFALLFAVCIDAFEEFDKGQIICLVNDTGEFELECDSLDEFVSSSDYCVLG